MILALAVGACGGIGAVLRYLTDGAVGDRISGPIPCGTLTVNAVGSFVLGLVAGLVWYHGVSDHWRLVVGTGLCGGLTTWSTAAWETVRLTEGRLYRQALIATFGGMALALGAAAAGIALAAAL